MGSVIAFFVAFFVSFFLTLIFAAPVIVANWFLFKKAGRPGWKALIPFYNSWVLYEILCGEGAKMFFLLIPFYRIYWSVVTCIALAHAYNQSTGFGVGLFFLDPVFRLILAFSKDATYQGRQKL